MKINFSDIKWATVMEAPDTESEDVEIQATDYGEDVDVENVNDVENEDLGAEDYNEGEDTGEEPTDETGEDTGEEPTDETGEDTGEEPTDTEGVNGNENPEEEQPDSAEDGSKSNMENNKYLINDFIELYNRICEVIEKLHTNKKLNTLRDPVYAKTKMNIEKLKDVTYDYITQRFNKESYVFNLYQFNLIIQAMNLNTELLSNSFAFRDEEISKNVKKKPK